jgi:hypothetical protein
MKNVVLHLIFLLVLPLTLFGQLQKGTWLIGGRAAVNTPVISSVDNPDVDDQTYVSLQLAPRFGYFLSKRWMIGGGLFSSVTITDGEAGTLISISPEVRYYFNPDHTTRNWFATLSDGFGAGLSTGSGVNVRASIPLIGVGVNQFLTPNVALEGLLSANFRNDENAIQLGLGLQFFLRPPGADTSAVKPALGKGTLLLGGSAGISNQERDFWRLEAAPNAGIFLTDRWVVGGAINLSYSFLTSGSESRGSLVGIIPFVRYYLNPNGGRSRWFLAADTGVVLGKITREGGIVPNLNYTGFLTSGKVGINHFLTPSLALEGTFGVHYADYESKDNLNLGSSTLRVGGDFGLQFFLGRR